LEDLLGQLGAQLPHIQVRHISFSFCCGYLLSNKVTKIGKNGAKSTAFELEKGKIKR